MSARGTASVESYAHKEAKRLLAHWLREAAEAAGPDGRADFAGLTWRVNRAAPLWGVWVEYPILSDYQGLDPVWDEAAERWCRQPPSYDDIVATGYRPMAILDIAIQHKGTIAFAVEVVHKHRCGPRKIGFLRDRLTLLEIPSYWVLGQVERPTAIPAEFWL